MFNLTSLRSVIRRSVVRLCGHGVIIDLGVSGFDVIVSCGGVIGLGVVRRFCVTAREAGATSNLTIFVRGHIPWSARSLFNLMVGFGSVISLGGSGVSGFNIFIVSVFGLGVRRLGIRSAWEAGIATNLTLLVRGHTPRSTRSLFNLTSLRSVISLGGSVIGLYWDGVIFIIGVCGFDVIVSGGWSVGGYGIFLGFVR